MNFVAKNFGELSLTELYEILRARSQIFILEQNMHCQDMDRVDYSSRHYYLEENGEICAYMRVYYSDDKETEVKIGRVLTLNHGKGHGRKLFEVAVSDIKGPFKAEKITVNARAITPKPAPTIWETMLKISSPLV